MLGFVIGALAIRRSGIYFSMITLALAQMLYFFFLQAPFTGGEDGLQSVPRGKFLGRGRPRATTSTLYYVVLGIFVLSFLLIYRTVHSPFGQVLKAIRENEPRAMSLGYDAARFKLLAFVLSAALAGPGRRDQDPGAGLRHADRRALDHLRPGHPDDAGRRHGHDGRADRRRVRDRRAGEQDRRHRHVPGRVTGIEWFNGLGESVTVVTGLIFIICVLAFRRGIVGEFNEWWAHRRAAAQA